MRIHPERVLRQACLVTLKSQLLKPEHPNYAGMTVNERLFAAGTLEQFDKAARTADRDTMLRLLVQVDIAEADARKTVDTILLNPARYGY
jgi:hypothetical protein